MEPFERLESEVRCYCRSFPAVFARGRGCRVTTSDGVEYLDFFAGAGALNYGHNHPRMKQLLIDYLNQDGIAHGLDLAIEAKGRFLDLFEASILTPRRLDYKVQFPGPTGTNAVEAALKLARKVTGRRAVVFFTNSCHGATLGSLAVTSNPYKRAGGGVPLRYAIEMPFDGFLGPGVDSLRPLEAHLAETAGTSDLPAAVIVETVQAEGGVNVAGSDWLTRLASLARRHGVLLIVDDVQVGCGRTGPFFSFEEVGLVPDIVCLSKSISGFGLPMALVLMKRELDAWSPGEHNCTSCGNSLAFVTAAVTLGFWRDDSLSREIAAKTDRCAQRLHRIVAAHPDARGEVRGRGLIQGICFEVPGLAGAVSRSAFARGLLIGTAGHDDDVLKLLPPLVIDRASLDHGLEIIEESLEAALGRVGRSGVDPPGRRSAAPPGSAP